MAFVLIVTKLIFLLVYVKSDVSEAGTESINEIGDNLIKSLLVDIDKKPNNKIKELKEKLKKIDEYIIDKKKYNELLTNETRDTNLTEINFYNALNENESFRYLTDNEPRSLYLKLKEKVNRDDILEMLEKSDKEKLAKSARRMGSEKVIDVEAESDEHNMAELDLAVDSLIAAKASDNHKFDPKDYESTYWDPQSHLEELKQYSKFDGRRLYKGERTTVVYYPFMASIHVMGRFWCGGAIYWHDLVLTSASCLQLMHNNRFFRENPKLLTVRVGSNHSRVGGEEIEALEVYFHPAYNPKTLKNNIAVIRLKFMLIFSYRKLPKIVPIATTDNLIPPTSTVLLLGWGVTRTTSKMRYEPVYLQRKFLPVYPNEFCKEVYGDKFITNKMFCAGTMTTGEGACDHDAGGPALVGGRLVGIISFGPSVCGYPNAPTVFTLVGAYVDWIENVNESFPRKYYQASKRTTTRASTYNFFTTDRNKKTTVEVATPIRTPLTTDYPIPNVTESRKRKKRKRRI